MKIFAVSIIVILGFGVTAHAESPQPFLFLKTGEKFATQETAAPTVSGLTAYIGSKAAIGTNAFAPRVMNDPSKAAEFVGKSKPALGIVTAGFYITYAKPLGMEPLLEVNRAGVKEEHYLLVAPKAGSDKLADWGGKTIATPLAGEQWYVTGVILQGKLGEEIRLQQTMDVEGSIFDLAEGSKKAADAVLVESTAWDVFKDDPDSGQKLKVLYQSDALPHDLVVTFGTKNDGLNIDKVKQAMKDMSGNADGQKILQSIRVDSFVDVNQARLSAAEKLFHGK